MGVDIKSLKVLVYIDRIQEDSNNFRPKEVVAIAKEIKRMWPDDRSERIWFDVEYLEARRNDWEFCFRVVCYCMPGKTERHPIPNHYLEQFVNRRMRIYPYVDGNYESNARFQNHIVEVIHVVE